MSLPAKKRRWVDPLDDKNRATFMDDEYASSSSPSFQSPDEDEDDYDLELDAQVADEQPTTSFRLPPTLGSESQESLGNFSPGFGTQPPPKITAKTPTPTGGKQRKKRKVSLSPSQDCLADPHHGLDIPNSKKVDSQSGNTKVVIEFDQNEGFSTVPTKATPQTSRTKTPERANASPISTIEAKELSISAQPKESQAKHQLGVVSSRPSTESLNKLTPTENKKTRSHICKAAKKSPVSKVKVPKANANSSTSKKCKAAKKSPLSKVKVPNAKKDCSTVTEVDKPSNQTQKEKSCKSDDNSKLHEDEKINKKSEPASTKAFGTKRSISKTDIPPGKKQKVSKATEDFPSKNEKITASMDKKTETSVTKTKKKKKTSFQDQLLSLMFMSCKPYTVKLLAQQLKSNEASIDFCMLSLVDKGWVIKKEFTSKGGRSKELYWANQQAKSKELIDALGIVSSREIQDANQQLSSLNSHYADLGKELAFLSQDLSNDELNSQLASTEIDVKNVQKRLDETLQRINNSKQQGQRLGKHPFTQSYPNKKQLKPLSQKQLKKRINDMRGEWRKRKDKCMDFVEQLADGMEKKVKDVVKILELETDEMEGVKMPPKYVIEK